MIYNLSTTDLMVLTEEEVFSYSWINNRDTWRYILEKITEQQFAYEAKMLKSAFKKLGIPIPVFLSQQLNNLNIMKEILNIDGIEIFLGRECVLDVYTKDANIACYTIGELDECIIECSFSESEVFTRIKFEDLISNKITWWRVIFGGGNFCSNDLEKKSLNK